MMTRKCLAAAMAVFLVIMGAASVAHGKKLRKVAVLAGFYGFGAGVHLLGGLGVLHGLYSHYRELGPLQLRLPRRSSTCIPFLCLILYQFPCLFMFITFMRRIMMASVTYDDYGLYRGPRRPVVIEIAASF
uniref:Putative conserved plasma membrane protein n=1 Tax=Ixodes ricinus TaxID=34613 RepID=A0A090XCN6_IXORI